MADLTTNYNLKKPTRQEKYDIAVNNENMDIIDGALNSKAEIKDIELKSIIGTGHTISGLNNGKYSFTNGKTVFTDYPTLLNTGAFHHGVVVVDSRDDNDYKTFQLIVTNNGGTLTKAMFGWCGADKEIKWFEPASTTELSAKLDISKLDGTTAVTDANLATTVGKYTASNTCLNLPVAKYGVIEVTTGNTKGQWVLQVFKTTEGQQYTREKINAGEWTTWKSTVTKDDMDALYNTKKIISPQTVLDFAIHAKHGDKLFVEATYFPSDLPTQAEGWLTVFVDHLTARRTVEFIAFTTVNVSNYYRSVYQTGWYGEWRKQVNSTDLNRIYSLLQFDARDTDQTPEWYMKNYTTRMVVEYKRISPTNGMQLYQVTTHVPWVDSTGGYPVQVAVSAKYGTWRRWGTSNTTWSGWYPEPVVTLMTADPGANVSSTFPNGSLYIVYE